MTTSRAVALSLAMVLLTGCTKTVQHRVAGYYPGISPTTQPVPKTAVYSIRFLDEKGKKTGGIPNSHRLIQAGDHAGFDIDESKGVVAVAGEASFPITIPTGYGAVWSTTYRRPTQFSKEVAKAAVATGKATGYIAAGVVEGVLYKLDEDEDMDEMFERMNRHLEDQRRLRKRRD